VTAVPAKNKLFAPEHYGQVVITLPEDIDITNSPLIRERLLEVIGRNPAVVIADMTATAFCDASGMAAIVTAHRRAVAAGSGMRLVIRHPGVRRIFELCGIDTVIGVYPDLPAALSGATEAVAGGAG
jgi:anti-sigma B factor antagonist